MTNNKDLQSLQQGHRARLRKKFLDEQLAEYELLELLLTYAIPRRDVHALARRLYNKYKNIQYLLAEPIESLMENEGVKENTAIFFKLIHKLTQLEYKSIFDAKPIFYDYDKMVNYCKILVGGKTIEEFYVFYLDKDFKLISQELHSTGTINWAAVYVREITKRALTLNARHIVLLHNHPTSGSFSTDDIEITHELANILKDFDIDVLDHLLVSDGIVYSAKNMFLLDKISK